MRWRLPAAAGVLFVLLLGTQVAFTAVGVVHSPAWQDPVEVAPTDGNGDIVATDIDGHGSGGTVAWVTRRGETWIVKAASLEETDDGVAVGETWTAARSDSELADVDVATDGDRTALAWERTAENEIVYYDRTTERTQVVSGGELRTGQPSVDLTADGAAVGWQFIDANGSGVRVASVADGAVTAATIGRPAKGIGVPVVAADGNDVAVIWLDSNASQVALTSVDVGDGVAVGDSYLLGEARPGGGFGQSTAIGVDGDRTGSSVRAAWTRGSAIDTGSVETTAGTVSEPRTIGDGSRPSIAVSEDGWTAAWLYQSRGSGWDVAVKRAGDDGPRTLSQLPANADQPRVAFTSSATVSWIERGEQSRLLVSSYRGERPPRAVDRLRTTPGRFAFLVVSSAVLGAITTPLMPWSFLLFLGGFVASSRLVTGVCASAIAAVTGRLGGPSEADVVRARLQSAPPAVYGVAFAVLQVAVAVRVVTTAQTARTLGFSHPLGIGIGAFVAAVVVYRLLELDSPWKFAGVAALTYNAALWTTATPLFL